MYTINVLDTKTDRFETIQTEETTFGAIKPELRKLGFDLDFKTRTFVIAETETEIISDSSQLGCCGELTELTLCIYPKDTKAGLTASEIDNMKFAEMRKEVSNIKAADKAGWEKHLSHLGGNPSNDGLKSALKAYYKGAGNAAAAPVAPAAQAAPKAAAKAESGEDRIAALDRRISALEEAVKRLGVKSVVDSVATAAPAKVAEDPEAAAKKAKADEIKKKAAELKARAGKRF